MKFKEWRSMEQDERRQVKWHHRPHIRVATLFGAVFFIGFFLVILRMLENTRVYVNRKPNNKEAYAISKEFVKTKLKMPNTASFPNSNFKSNVDTAHNTYEVQSTVRAEDVNGKVFNSPWDVKLIYTGGNWDEKNSYKVVSIDLGAAPK